MPWRLSDRLLSWLGLDFDISLDRDPFNRIQDDLFLGSCPVPGSVAGLKEAGITHVFSCLAEPYRAEVAFLSDSFRTHFEPVHDGMHEAIEPVFQRFFAFVEQAGQERADARVLVHCQVGVSRSATLAIALVMQRTGLSFFEAYRTVHARRAEILPNIGFASQLQRLEQRLGSSTPTESEVSSLARYLHEVCRVPVELDVLEDAVIAQEYDAVAAIRSIFGDDIPRVVQGVRR